jgi:hypothetical protein
MKKSLIIASLGMFILGGCTKDLTDDNINPKAPEHVPAGTLFANAEKELADYMSSPNVNVNTFRLWSQQWTQTTYTDESNYELIERNINGEVFDRMYARVLRDLSEVRATIDADAFVTGNDALVQNAMITVLEVYSFQVLVDIFGDVPYSAAIRGGEGGEMLTPAYDNANDIYKDLAARIKQAASDLGTGGSAGDLGGSDLIYGGDAASWQAFANSLLLKIAVRYADVDAATAQGWATDAINSGNLITSAGMSAAFPYASTTPNTNPLWEDLVQSGRTDFIASNTIADMMNANSDPRRGAYFRNLDSLGNVLGNAFGAGGSYYNYSQPSDLLENPTIEGMLMSAEEVYFLMADAANRGWTGDDVGSHVDMAMDISIERWTGAASDYTDSVNFASLTGGGMTATEVIAMQKWLAMYNQGFEAWSTWRFYDYPTMNVAAEAGTTPPLRYNYSVDEYSVNPVQVAAANGGSDNTMDRVFWDKN